MIMDPWYQGSSMVWEKVLAPFVSFIGATARVHRHPLLTYSIGFTRTCACLSYLRNADQFKAHWFLHFVTF